MNETNAALSELLEANGARFIGDLDRGDIKKRFGHNLPHWMINEAIYHVRFRLHDSIPHEKALELANEKEILLSRLKGSGKGLTQAERRQLLERHTDKVERILDEGYGKCRLREKPVADLVANAVKYFENQRYVLYAWVVMPNHVHCVVQPFKSAPLPKIIHSWKSYTANRANELLGRSGSFWQREYFDHIIRDEDELIRTIEYVYDNPENAGLSERTWRFKVI